MEVDISDILAEVSRPSSSFPSHPQSLGDSSSAASTTTTDHQLLVRAWTSERCSPDLLPYPTQLMARVMDRVAAQIARIEDMAAGGDMSSSSDSGAHVNGYDYSGPNRSHTNSNQNRNLTLSILQTDLSRTQFLVRSLLRQRLSKLSKYSGFYLRQISESESKDKLVLSAAEIQFLEAHHTLLAGFYEGSFLSALPAGLRRLDDGAGGGAGVNMVEGPDPEGKSAVVVRCLGETWANEVGLDDEGGVEVELRMRRGEVWVVRWGDVKAGVSKGDLELL